MTNWIDVDEAKTESGLRLVITVGVPGPWGEAAKGVFRVKNIPFKKVPQDGGGANSELQAWTGETNAPQAIFNTEKARSGWRDIIALAERISPLPSLLPEEAGERELMFELVNDLAGENGFGWTRRLMLFAGVMALPDDHPVRERMNRMTSRYGYDDKLAARAPEHAAAIIGKIGEQWRKQREEGQPFLIGKKLSALDIYWAAFAGLVEPLPPEICPMPEALRAGYLFAHPALEKVLDPELLEHRLRVYEDWLGLPIDLGP